jgi:hypothetical protein
MDINKNLINSKKKDNNDNDNININDYDSEDNSDNSDNNSDVSDMSINSSLFDILAYTEQNCKNTTENKVKINQILEITQYLESKIIQIHKILEHLDKKIK